MTFSVAGLGSKWAIVQKYLLLLVPDGVNIFDWTTSKFLANISVPGVSCIKLAGELAILGTCTGQVYSLATNLQLNLLKTFKFPISDIAFLPNSKDDVLEYVLLTHESDKDGAEELAKVYLSNGKCMLQGRGHGILDASPEGIVMLATKCKLQRWDFSSDQKATRVLSLTHTESIYQCHSTINGDLLISDHSGKIIEYSLKDGRIQEGKKVIRHWHSLPQVDFVLLEGGGIVSGGQESVMVKWSASAGDEKGGKHFLPRLGGPITRVQVAEHQECAYAFLSTSDEELVVVDLAAMKVKTRLQLWAGKNSPVALMHPAFPSVMLTNVLGGLQFYNIREQISYQLHHPEPLDRITPNEAKETVKYPQVYAAAYSSNGDMLATVEVNIGDTHIMRIYSASDLEQLEEECTVYQPHGFSPVSCAWQDEDTLVSHSASLQELKVWKRGRSALEEDMGKWRVVKQHTSVSLFVSADDTLVMLKDGNLLINQHALELPLISISDMWMDQGFLILQANDNQVLVVDLAKKKLLHGFSNVSILSISRGSVLYDYHFHDSQERFLAQNVKWDDLKNAWERVPATNAKSIMHCGDTLIKRLPDHLQVDFAAPIVEGLALEKPMEIVEESEEEEEQPVKRQRRALSLRKALLPLISSHQLPPVPEIFDLFVSS